jgi:hypothetical protein
MKDYRKLEVWSFAHQITLKLYRVTAKFPREELGRGRRGNGESHRFLQIASGSASELDYHLLLTHDLGLMTEETYRPLNTDLGRLRRKLTTLILKVDEDRQGPKCRLPSANCVPE